MSSSLVERYVRAQLDGDRSAALAIVESAIESGLPLVTNNEAH